MTPTQLIDILIPLSMVLVALTLVDYVLWLRAWRRMGLRILKYTNLGPGAGFYLTVKHWKELRRNRPCSAQTPTAQSDSPSKAPR